MEAWNIKQLEYALQRDLAMCNMDHERAMARTIGGREIREKAIELAKTRKLTPAEVAIAQKYGYK